MIKKILLNTNFATRKDKWMSLGIWKYSLIQDKLIEDIVYAKGNQGVLTKVTQKKDSTCTDISFF